MLVNYLNTIYSLIKNDSTSQLLEFEHKEVSQLNNNNNKKDNLLKGSQLLEDESSQLELKSNSLKRKVNSGIFDSNFLDLIPFDMPSFDVPDAPSTEIPEGENSPESTSDQPIDSKSEKPEDIKKEDKPDEEDKKEEEEDKKEEKEEDKKEEDKETKNKEIKSGEFITRDFNKEASYQQISMEDPFEVMPAHTEKMLDEDRQIRNTKRIRNHEDNIESERNEKRHKNLKKFGKTFLNEESNNYEESFSPYFVPEFINDYERINDFKSKKLFIPRSIENNKLNSLKDKYENIKTKSIKPLIKESKDKQQLELNKEDKANLIKSQKIEEKIRVAKEESKQEELSKKMTELLGLKSNGQTKSTSISLPTTLETPEISRNLFENNIPKSTTEKENGLNNKLIIEQINESEKQMKEIEDLINNVKANLIKFKEELQSKRDDQRNIELNIIEVKEKNPDK